MRKIIFLMHVSLDGFVAGPNGEMDWIGYDEEVEQAAHALHAQTDAAIYGRVTYQMMEGYWPSVLDNPSSTAAELNHARWVDKATKVVVSTTLESVEWNNTVLIKDNVVEEITQLKQQPGQNMWLLGSPTLAQTLMNHNLIDEYRLNISPVILGKGIPLFTTMDHQLKLKLVETQTYSCGVVLLRYEPA